MAKEKPQIRLPELPLFKRFSLVLRQEFATADEVLKLVEKTTNRINKLVQKAEDERRREEADAAAEPVVEEMPEELEEEEGLEYEEDEAEEIEDEGVSEIDDEEAETSYDQDEAPDAPAGESRERPRADIPGDEAQEDWRFPIDDDLPLDLTDDTPGKPFWEDDDETPSSRRRAKKRTSRSKTATKKAAPEIVRVGARGKPVGKISTSSVRAGRSKKSTKKPAAKKSRGKSSATRKR